MAGSDVIFLPSIFWKIGDVSDWCEKRGPTFTLFGAKWRLKFSYTTSPVGNRYSIILKRYGDCVESVSLNVSAQFLEECGQGHARQTSILNTSAKLDKHVLWDSGTGFFTPDYSRIVQIYCFYCNMSTTKFDFKSKIQYNSSEKVSEVVPVEYAACETSLCHDFGSLFDNPVMSDVTLECDGQKIFAHSVVLAARSKIFAAMLFNEKGESGKWSIEIKDTEFTVLEQLVRYIYKGKLQHLTADTVCKIYSAAQGYGVEALEMKCGAFMADNSVAPNLSQAVSIKQANGGSGDRQTVLSNFTNVKAIFDTEEWKKLTKDEPKFASEVFQFFVSKSQQ